MSHALVSNPPAERRGAVSALRDYLSMLKLRVVALLVLTAVGAMFPAARGWPTLSAVVGVALGGTLAAGGAESINAWFDRDIDRVMSRTSRRPLPSGRIPPWHALVMGLTLNLLAFAVLALLANVLAAVLALVGTAIYVLVYTMWLKRLTPQNIVIGGASGAMPPLVGWAAAAGHLDLTALALFLVVFFWTPPHFWALAQILKRDYADARVPMMPVVQGDRTARRQSVVYAILAVAASLVPYLTHHEGAFYLVGAVVLGAILIGFCLVNLGGQRTRQLWVFSMAYLGLLFTLLALGSFLL
ncbi:MAG TPA: heme o synthase [Candidatus Nitrosotalea sp.]|nr:heme o synthase [Candidatus Nitrosotalea sp.]